MNFTAQGLYEDHPPVLQLIFKISLRYVPLDLRELKDGYEASMKKKKYQRAIKVIGIHCLFMLIGTIFKIKSKVKILGVKILFFLSCPSHKISVLNYGTAMMNLKK